MVEPYACLRQLIASPGQIELVASRIGAAEPRFADEEALTVGWTPRRRAEFLGGRACARRAMAALGAAPCPVLFDADGVPCWPSGIIGSISHKRGFCVAAAARLMEFASIGVDLERDAMEPALMDEICLPAEADRLGALHDRCDQPLALVLSAKEAFFKCQYPIARRFLRWRDIAVAFGEGIFTVAVDGRPEPHLAGRFSAADGWVATLAAIPRTTLTR